MWRPEDWKNPYFPEPYPELSVLVKIEQQAGYNTLARAAFEAGADAILEAIWELAKNSPTKTFIFDANVKQILESK